MKPSKFILFSFLLSLNANAQIDSLSHPLETIPKAALTKFKDFQIKDFNDLKSAIDIEEVPFGASEVLLEDEFIKLFDPDGFKCDYDQRLIKNIKKIVVSKGKNDSPDKFGFIPSLVSERIKDSPAIKISGLGSTILANSFIYSYQDNGQTIKKSATIIDSPTAKNFDIQKYIEPNASSFLYNLDCSGYLSAVLNANVGVSGNSVEASAKAAYKTKNSLLIISGIMYSPIYQSYRGFGAFKENTKDVLELRKEILNNILKSLPDYASKDETQIVLASDYKIVITSNRGDSSFNGEGSLSGQAGVGFGFGSFSTKGDTGGQIERKSNFSDFDCYVIKKNNLNQPDYITVKTLKEKIKSIESQITTAVATKK